MKFVVAMLVLSLNLGCSSTFKTSQFDAVNWKPVGEAVEGIVFYEPHQVRVTYVFTALVIDGKLVGTAEQDACAKVVQKQEILVEPNFAAPRVLLNSPSPFSAGKLSVTLSNGMITNVNSESTPKAPELIKEITGLATAAGIFSAKATDARAACNAAPMIESKAPFRS